MEGRPRHAVTAGRIGLLVVAIGTAWGAMTTAGGGSDLDAVLVAAPAAAPTNPHPAVAAPAPVRPAAPERVSRDQVRAASRLPSSVPTSARTHAAR
jgi:hypothetical protein